MKDIETEVAIVGSGLTGSAVAWRLALAGVDCVCLEQGQRFDHGAARSGAGRAMLQANPNLRRGPDDTLVDDVGSPIKPMVGHAVGGSSIYWSSHLPRFSADDFRVRSLDGVADDWPIGLDDLAPFYALNEARMGVASTAIAPDGGRPPLPTIGTNGHRFAAAFERLGWLWRPVDLARGPNAEAEPCRHPGPCHVGCPARLRSGAERTYLDDAVRSGARLHVGLTVLRLEHDDSGRVTAALCRDGAEEMRVRARAFVLAANGMGTPRLLLLSASERFPDGLANGSGLVGRNLMLHPYGRVDGLFEAELGTMAEEEVAGIVCFEFRPTRSERGFVRGCKLQLAPGPGATALAEGGLPPGWGADNPHALLDRTCAITVCAEDLPDPSNRIDLSPALADRHGLPAPRMTYAVSANSRAILDFGLARAAEAMRQAGAMRLHETPLRAQAGFHIMGTARMGEDPASSVVDPFGRCHESPNLFVADASVFVTASASNPTHTAQALALRTADQVIADLR